MLRLAVAEGPVLLVRLHQTDEHVLTAQADARVQPVSDRLIERALLIKGATLIEGDL